LPAFKLGNAVSYIGHAFPTCRLMCFELVMWSRQRLVYSYWQNHFRTVFASWDKI